MSAEDVETVESRVGQRIRHTHPNGFRSGEWATVVTVVEAHGRPCWLVEFPDLVTDLFACVDPVEPYEFKEAPDA